MCAHYTREESPQSYDFGAFLYLLSAHFSVSIHSFEYFENFVLCCNLIARPKYQLQPRMVLCSQLMNVLIPRETRG